ncbi:hypothetical protein T492DRAFT_1054357 [Pavlovales sp. CCMP2436]|nr:hypothetical protein T492DRAFT_1054357 [Pavlovales sp. CCMP2436]|mmetsp:Transcript_23207/g.54980  ORF Transcript_23207/g.54980 Transcript_23207/m.54980 type:complete len:424 (-) Transcript_23207:41-1312(-)
MGTALTILHLALAGPTLIAARRFPRSSSRVPSASMAMSLAAIEQAESHASRAWYELQTDQTLLDVVADSKLSTLDICKLRDFNKALAQDAWLGMHVAAAGLILARDPSADASRTLYELHDDQTPLDVVARSKLSTLDIRERRDSILKLKQTAWLAMNVAAAELILARDPSADASRTWYELHYDQAPLNVVASSKFSTHEMRKRCESILTLKQKAWLATNLAQAELILARDPSADASRTWYDLQIDQTSLDVVASSKLSTQEICKRRDCILKLKQTAWLAMKQAQVEKILARDPSANASRTWYELHHDQTPLDIVARAKISTLKIRKQREHILKRKHKAWLAMNVAHSELILARDPPADASRTWYELRNDQAPLDVVAHSKFSTPEICKRRRSIMALKQKAFLAMNMSEACAILIIKGPAAGGE